jgi:hypothetical protein
MVFLLAAIVGLAYGAADQYLGSLRLLDLLGVWPSTASQMSAPWLVLPFAFGCSQRDARRAVLAGLVVTQAALLGYFAMTLSPLEGVHPDSAAIAGLLGTNMQYVIGGLITGALYGLLGQRWHTSRSWVSAALVTGALCLEPLARVATGRLSPPDTVWDVEVAVGLAAAAAFAVVLARHRRTAPLG